MRIFEIGRVGAGNLVIVIPLYFGLRGQEFAGEQRYSGRVHPIAMIAACADEAVAFKGKGLLRLGTAQNIKEARDIALIFQPDRHSDGLTWTVLSRWPTTTFP